jgi:hypothetical protein
MFCIGRLSADVLVTTVVDRILEPQTIAHFIEFTISGKLPSGRSTSLPLVKGEEAMLINVPFSEWAPSPFNGNPSPPIEKVMMRVGSHEDGNRLQVITKELHAMKSRIWEGMLPLSERRWREKKLDDAANFPVACQIISLAVDVFHYLNHESVQAALRQTFNLIFVHFKEFEDAINAKRAGESIPPVKVSALWEEFIKDHYSIMVNMTHNWVIERIERLRVPIETALQQHELSLDQSEAESLRGPDALQWELSNKIHDLVEISSHADYGIFVPMDGYWGYTAQQPASRPGQSRLRPDPNAPARDSDVLAYADPISFSPSWLERRRDYVLRLKHISRRDAINEVLHDIEQGSSTNRPRLLSRSGSTQIAAQRQVRRELRGEPMSMPSELPWVSRVKRETTKWGYVGYRWLKDDGQDWQQFREKFEADISNWGDNLAGGVEEVKVKSKVHWIDAQDLGIPQGDIEALKK